MGLGVMYQRLCDYCKKPCDKYYYYITAKPSMRESHMCRWCWKSKAMGKGIRKVIRLSQ